MGFCQTDAVDFISILLHIYIPASYSTSKHILKNLYTKNQNKEP